MKNANTSTPENGSTYTLPAISSLKSKLWELSNQLDTAAAQLEALLCVGSSDEFREYSEEIQSNYLWACHTLAKNIRDLLITQWQAYKALNPTGSQTPADDVINTFKRVAVCFCTPPQADLIGIVVEAKLAHDTKKLAFLAEQFASIEPIAKQLLAEITTPAPTPTKPAKAKRNGGAV